MTGRCKQNQFAGGPIISLNRLNRIKYWPRRDHHSRAAAEWPIVHALMFTDGPIADIPQANIHSTRINRQLKQALRQIPRENLREKSQHIESHGPPVGMGVRPTW